MEPNWAAVARAVSERMDELGMSQMDLVRRSGVSDATIRRLTRGDDRYGFRRTSLAAVSKALGWRPDALTAISRGEDPPRTVDYLDRQTLIEKVRAVRVACDELEDIVRRTAPDY